MGTASPLSRGVADWDSSYRFGAKLAIFRAASRITRHKRASRLECSWTLLGEPDEPNLTDKSCVVAKRLQILKPNFLDSSQDDGQPVIGLNSAPSEFVLAAGCTDLNCSLDQRILAFCPHLDSVAVTASVSATDSVPQKDHAVAEPVLVNQFQLQPHTIGEEPFSGADDRRAEEHLNLVNKTGP